MDDETQVDGMGQVLDETPAYALDLQIDPADDLLAFWVRLAQRVPDFRIGLTLNVAGSVITGQLVGRNDWLELLGTHVADASRAAFGEGALADDLARLMQDWKLPVDHDPNTVYGYIHLAGARFISGDRLVPTAEDDPDGLLWRGRLGEVAGWSFGGLAPDPASDDI